MLVTATSRPAAAMTEIIKGFMRNLLSIETQESCSDLINEKHNVAV
jgi:hypothetical protein